MELKVDEEFKSYLIPLKQEEYELLEKSLKEEGCREPIITWNGTIVDGHNRYEICRKHGIPFEVQEKQFANREEAIEWIIRNQLSRRNLTADEFKLLIGQLYHRLKKRQGRPKKEQAKCCQNGNISNKQEQKRCKICTFSNKQGKKRTEAEIAEKFGVSPLGFIFWL